MPSNHTLQHLIDDEMMRQGFALIEWVREAIRAHFKANNEFPAEVALPPDRFREFEKYYPDWVRLFNEQNPTTPFQARKNQHHHIIFGMTVIVPKAAP